VERPARKRSPPQVRLDDRDQWFIREPPSKPASQRRIKLNRDDPRPRTGKRRGQRAVPGAEIEDKVAVTDAARPDELPDQALITEEVRTSGVRPKLSGAARPA
jgi:hypothetical protein